MARWSTMLLPGVLATAMIVAGQAQTHAAGITEDNIDLFTETFAAVELIGLTYAVCQELEPDYRAAQRTTLDVYAAQHSVASLTAFIHVMSRSRPEVERAMPGILKKYEAKLRASLGSDPKACRDGFENVLNEIELPNIATFMRRFGLDTKADKALTGSADNDTHSQTSGADFPMPTELRRVEKTLPGLSWRVPDGVRSHSHAPPCFWRCAGFQYKGRVPSFPTLAIQEALPLKADDAIDAVFSRYKDPVLEQRDVDVGPFVGRVAMRPDRLVIRDVYVKYVVGQHRYRTFALEKSGLSVVAILYYPRNDRGDEETTNSMVQLITTLKMDVAAVHGSLRAPVQLVTVKRPSSNEPPAADEVIYAEEPSIVYNTRLVGSFDGPVTSFQFDADTRTMKKSVLDSEGPELEIDGEIYQHMPRQPDGTTIEGVFESPYRYQVFDIVFDLLDDARLAFNRNGRFGIVSSRDYRNGLVSVGVFSKGIGTYRINGYMIELRSDNGEVQQDLFFSYGKKINLAGKVMYPL